MEHVAPTAPRSTWQSWLRFDVALLLLCVVGVLALGWPVIGWALLRPIAVPLTFVSAAAMVLLPGLALLRWLWPAALAPAERWPLAIGLSCAMPPVLLLMSMLVGLHWNSLLCWSYLALAAGALAWPRRGETITSRIARLRTWLDRTNLLLIALTLLAVAARMYPARDLPVGMYGDSYHHTIISQLLVDHGGLFSSWQPYAALRTFTYHFGFHSNVAWLHWLSGVPVTRGLLIVGQLQSALVVPLTFVFTRRALGNERAALWAALVVGFGAVMPAYYVNWGRYTQLAGQLVLPAVCVCWMELLDFGRRTTNDGGRATSGAYLPSSIVYRLSSIVILTVLATAGLVLTHYRIAAFAACFVVVYGMYMLIIRVRSWRAFGALAGRGLLAGGLVLLLVLPWLLRLREGSLLKIGEYYASQNIGADDTNALPTMAAFFASYAGYYLTPLAIIGLLLLLLQRNWRALLLIGWAGAVWLAANPYLIGLNGAGILSNFAVLIAVYMVFAPLAGAGPAVLTEWLGRTPAARHVLASLQLVGGAALVVWGLGWQAGILDTSNELFTPADAMAMNWIKQETPPDARFFVNSFGAYGDTVYVGSDGGWWLPFMTGRQSNLPPISQGHEAGEQPNYQLTVTAHNRALESHPVGSHEEAEALRAAGYSYLYDGPAASLPGKEYIDPQALSHSPYYELVYHKDGVAIWKVR
ncbi:MAG TPA: hypothetical protein VFT66_16145 [Roseiflexaceae bacterium]|nr:hypothetical protein [Roseiflexaceae bacterium]